MKELRKNYWNPRDWDENFLNEENFFFPFNTSLPEGEWTSWHEHPSWAEFIVLLSGSAVIETSTLNYLANESQCIWIPPRTNHTFYVVAKEGDTFESVGEIFDISPKMLRKFNDMATGALKRGDIVYIERKKTQWLGNTMQHKVVRDENLYSLSQSYGIRLKSLAKLNRLRANEDVKKGDIIKLK